MNKLLASLLALLLFTQPVNAVVTPNKQYTQQSTGSNVNTWGIVLNSVLGIIDNNLGGTNPVNISSASGGTYAVSVLQAQYVFQDLSGTLTGNVNYQFPAKGGIYFINNSTTGAYTVTVSVVGGGATIGVAQNASSWIGVDATALNVVSLTTAGPTGFLVAANNLSDLVSISTARTNLGLGTAATVNVGTSGATLPYLNGNNIWSGTNAFNTGTLMAATQTAGDASANVATDGFVNGTALTLTNGTTAVTQAAADASSDVATDAFVNTTALTLANGTTAHTQSTGNNTTFVATTQFVNGTALTLTNGTTATTQANTDNSTKVATTGYVKSQPPTVPTALGVGSIVIAEDNFSSSGIPAGSAIAGSNLIVGAQSTSGSFTSSGDTASGTWQALQSINFTQVGLFQRTN